MICADCKWIKKCSYPPDTAYYCRRYDMYVHEQTNEEWLKSKDTADLAEWIYNAMFNKSVQNDVADGAYMQMMTKKDYIESWLCEVHKE